MFKIAINEIHAVNVLQRIWEQCESEQFCDVMLIGGTDKVRIPAHRSILCASSDFFKTMFAPAFNESTAREVELPKVDGDILKSIVKYCYTGHVEISEDNVEKLLETSDALLLDVVKDCGNFLAEHLDLTNCLGYAILAERYHCKSLLKTAKDFCLEHFADVSKTDEFLMLNANQVGQLLESDDLCVPAEEHVFKSLMTWLEHDRFERQQHKDELFKLVRMPLMELLYLAEYVKPVCTSTACVQLYMEAMEWHSVPERRILNSSKSTKHRRCRELMMGIKRESNTLKILYLCPQRLERMKYSINLNYCRNCGLTVMKNYLFIVGGVDTAGNSLNTVICLNLKTMTLKDVSPMNERRSGVRAVVLKGLLYAVGGYNGHNYLSSVEKWDSETNTWHEVAPMSVSRDSCGFAVLNEKIYVIGRSNVANDLGSAEYYDPQYNVWTSIASINEIRQLPEVLVSNGMLYARGACMGKTIDRYNPESDSWITTSNINTESNFPVSTALLDKLIIFYKDRVEEYNPTTNEWKVNASIKRLVDAEYMFSYSGELSVSDFIEN